MTTYLVRHASAGRRDDSDPDDAERPLDEAGRSQAERLAAWLSHEPITRILTSPYRRCVESVGPLARLVGLDLEIVEDLGEGTPVERSWEVLASAARTDAVLCSHGDVIPDLIRRAQMRGLVVPGKSGSAKGSVWTLQHWDGERFATGVYTPIPREPGAGELAG